MKHASRIIILLLSLGFLFQAVPQAQAQSATPYYWYGADNTVWNLRIQIYQAQQQLTALYYRARVTRFSPQGYQNHCRRRTHREHFRRNRIRLIPH